MNTDSSIEGRATYLPHFVYTSPYTCYKETCLSASHEASNMLTYIIHSK